MPAAVALQPSQRVALLLQVWLVPCRLWSPDGRTWCLSLLAGSQSSFPRDCVRYGAPAVGTIPAACPPTPTPHLSGCGVLHMALGVLMEYRSEAGEALAKYTERWRGVVGEDAGPRIDPRKLGAADPDLMGYKKNRIRQRLSAAEKADEVVLTGTSCPNRKTCASHLALYPSGSDPTTHPQGMCFQSQP